MKAPWGLLLFLAACLVVMLRPMGDRIRSDAGRDDAFPGWPAEFEGRPLQGAPLAGFERAFGEAFPGRMGRFTDGSRVIVLRWVTAPTHQVHSSADCLQAAGWTVKPEDWRRDPDGTLWSVWTAAGPNGLIRVRERCRDGRGASWPDISSWFWAATLGRSEGPWWIESVAERADGIE